MQEKTIDMNYRRPLKICNSMSRNLVFQILLSITVDVVVRSASLQDLRGAWSITVSPPLNYTLFVNDTSTITLDCTGVGSVIIWQVDGNGSYAQAVLQRGILTKPLSANISYVSSRLVIPTTTVNNNTEMICKIFDSSRTLTQYSRPQYIRLQGPLDAPSNFTVVSFNSTFILTWGAPFSLHVTDSSVDVFYYVLCSNVSEHGCMAIPSAPDCNFPKSCTSSIDFYALGEWHRSLTDYKDPIQFLFFAFNGAGNGTAGVVIYRNSDVEATRGTVSAVQSTPTSSTTMIAKVTSREPNETFVTNSSKSTSTLIAAWAVLGGAASVCVMILGAVCTCVQAQKKMKGNVVSSTVATNPLHQVTHKKTHDVIENMEPCPAYAQIHEPVYEDVRC